MSAKQVTHSALFCDGCDVRYEHIATPVRVLRDMATGDGWKHRTVRYASSNWSRQVDLCPTCEEPKERL